MLKRCGQRTEDESSTLLTEKSAPGSPVEGKLSPNILRAYAEASFWSLAHTLCWNQLLSLYLFALAPDARLVGISEGVQGVARLLFSPVIGMLVDKSSSRNRLLRQTCSFGVLLHVWAALLVALPSVLPSWIERMTLWYGTLAFVAIYATLQQRIEKWPGTWTARSPSSRLQFRSQQTHPHAAPSPAAT